MGSRVRGNRHTFRTTRMMHPRGHAKVENIIKHDNILHASDATDSDDSLIMVTITESHKYEICK